MKTAEQYAAMAEENAFVSPETAQVFANLAIASAVQDLAEVTGQSFESIQGGIPVRVRG